MQPVGASRVIFRELVPVLNRQPRRSAFEIAQARTWPNPLPAWLFQKQRVSNWVLAFAFASTLGISAVVSTVVIHQPSASTPIVASMEIPGPVAPLTTPKLLPIVRASSVNAANVAAHGQIATLQGQVTTMNGDLQRLQQDGAALRDETQNQSSDISAARANLAGSEEGLQGESQQLTGRLDATHSDVQTRLGDLGTQIKSADQLVNDVRTLLGLPATTNLAVGGGG